MSFHRATAVEARNIARKLKTKLPELNLSFGVVRDAVDLASGGDMANAELDRLTNMTLRRLQALK